MIDFGSLRRIGRDLRKNFVPILDVKLREKEIHLLSLIEKHPDEPFVFFSERLGMERSSFSYLTEALELKGFLVKTDALKDKRTKSLMLTDKGKLISKEIEQQFSEYLKDLLSVLSQEEKEEVDSCVETIKEIMAKVKI